MTRCARGAGGHAALLGVPVVLGVLGVLAVLASACGPSSPRTVSIRVTAPVASGLDLTAVRWDVPVLTSVVRRGVLSLSWNAAEPPARVTLRHPEACDAYVDLAGVRESAPLEVGLRPLIDLGETRPQIGWDTAFEVTVAPGCRVASAGRVTWTQKSGAPLRDWAVARNGFSLRARTERLADARPEPVPWGVLPISPRTRGEHVLVARWRGRGRRDVVRELHVSAAARASGLPSIALGTRVYLGGSSSWTLRSAPPASHAAPDTSGPLVSLEPDVRGRFVLSDADGRELVLRAGVHDETPLDCGRGECHGAAGRGVRTSPMTSVLMRGLEGQLGPRYDPRCAISCHAVGEPGLEDGGLVHVARSLEWTLPRGPRAHAWDAVPRAVRRLGGVGCTACHGPGAIPEAASRWGIVRTDVCAVCHDAPPRYGHVAAWRSSRMARSDANPAVRDDPACAACHTTQGFLMAIGVRPAATSTLAPDEAGPIGITCAACHAVHSADPIGSALIRRVPPAPAIARMRADARSSVCARCHSPDSLSRAPAASAVALVLGSTGRTAATGAPLQMFAPHARLTEPCLDCHTDARAGVSLERGASHAFGVDVARCVRCHVSGPPPEPRDGAGRTLHQRALALAAQVGVTVTSGAAPPHARSLPIDLATPRGRAMWDLLLVVEDPAAWAHGGRYARALVEEAERTLLVLPQSVPGAPAP